MSIASPSAVPVSIAISAAATDMRPEVLLTKVRDMSDDCCFAAVSGFHLIKTMIRVANNNNKTRRKSSFSRPSTITQLRCQATTANSLNGHQPCISGQRCSSVAASVQTPGTYRLLQRTAPALTTNYGKLLVLLKMRLLNLIGPWRPLSPPGKRRYQRVD
ncbi:hypothetical protein IF2G_02616 [Cordyceps javanica]|nr:hypothetical protein IF2G_02616 [Cordyceps javanica]